MPAPNDRPGDFPMIRTVGLNGMIVSFADSLSEASNRATIAFRAALELALPDGVTETSASLASVYIRFDPNHLAHDRLEAHLSDLLQTRDWYTEPLPDGRRFWRVPTVYGTDLAPQLGEAAQAAGLSESAAIDALSAARTRVLTIGFAPGQPYLGTLGEEWDLPRQTELTPRVPAGALVLAIRQFVLFSSSTPTGWRHVGQTGFRIFQPDQTHPFALRPGDELQFDPVTPAEFTRLTDADPAFGGASAQEIPA